MSNLCSTYVRSSISLMQEFWCILHGFLYFLAIPSMSMLLMLYSLCNLHVVSWGTREAPKPAESEFIGLFFCAPFCFVGKCVLLLLCTSQLYAAKPLEKEEEEGKKCVGLFQLLATFPLRNIRFQTCLYILSQ